MVYIAKVKTKAANYDMLSASPAHGIVLWHNAPSLMVYSLCISKAVNLTDPRKNNLYSWMGNSDKLPSYM